MSLQRSQNSRISISVPLPKDEDGMVGRECPQPDCQGYFKVKEGTGLLGPDLLSHCPYCGCTNRPDHFWTKDQVRYAESVALRRVSQAIFAQLKDMEFDHKPSGLFGIGISLKVNPGAPVPLRQYRERALEARLKCESCTLEYAIFGVFGFCPDCGLHNSFQILRANLDLVRKEVNLALEQADALLANHLIEDALENCVSSFDSFAREACKVRAGLSADPNQAGSLSFQNLPRANAKLTKLFNCDFQGSVSPSTWALVHVAFMRRHLIAHKAGVIDEQYIKETGEHANLMGRRVAVAAKGVYEVAEAVSGLGEALLRILPAL